MRSIVWYSKISVFSLIEVLLIFLRYLRKVLFLRMVISALIGLVLCLCQDFNCPMSGQDFAVSVLIFLRMVISALIGLVLCLCQDFNCPMRRQDFDVSVLN